MIDIIILSLSSLSRKSTAVLSDRWLVCLQHWLESSLIHDCGKQFLEDFGSELRRYVEVADHTWRSREYGFEDYASDRDYQPCFRNQWTQVVEARCERLYLEQETVGEKIRSIQDRISSVLDNSFSFLRSYYSFECGVSKSIIWISGRDKLAILLEASVFALLDWSTRSSWEKISQLQQSSISESSRDLSCDSIASSPLIVRRPLANVLRYYPDACLVRRSVYFAKGVRMRLVLHETIQAMMLLELLLWRIIPV